jgi:hypothetical protein
MIKRYEFRKRDFKREINPDMKFTTNSRLPKSKSQAPAPVKSKKTFINALQFFYNKINISDQKPGELPQNHRASQLETDFRKTSAKELGEDEAGVDPSRKKEEAMNFIGDVAKAVLTKYEFFPKTDTAFLREGDGRHCSNPAQRDREVYLRLLHNSG